mgnify:CR=1 FL=1
MQASELDHHWQHYLRCCPQMAAKCLVAMVVCQQKDYIARSRGDTAELDLVIVTDHGHQAWNHDAGHESLSQFILLLYLFFISLNFCEAESSISK